MKVGRRRFLHLAAAAAALPSMSRLAYAQPYPTRPVRIIVGNAAGGTQDIIARLIGQWLSERLGQQFIIENRPGTNTNIGAQSAARAAPDGYTLLLVGSPNAINTTFYDKAAVDLNRDIKLIAGISRNSFIMVANQFLPTKTLAEFTASAKANPGKLNMASAGNGTLNHLLGELFKMMTGIDMLHVPYRGEAPALTDLLSGQVQVYFGGLSGTIPHLGPDTLRALAVSTATRLEALPGIPTVGESVPGYEATSWAGIGAPRRTPVEIVEKLNTEINAALSDPTVKRWIADRGGVAMPMSPAEFGKLVTDDTEKWARVIKFAGIRPD